MRTSIFALAAALAASPLPAWGAVGDFRLPTPSASPSASDRQGPVAPDVPESRVRAAPTPAPTPTPTPSPAPVPVDTPSSAPVIAVPILPPAAAGRPAPAPARAGQPAVTLPEPAATPAPAPIVQPDAAILSPLPGPSASATPAPAIAPREDGGFPWWWAAGAALLALAAGAAAVWKLRQRSSNAPVITAPVIERPRIAPQPAPEPAAAAPPPPPAARPAEPFQLALQPLRLSLTLMNASLAYRLEITNHGLAPLENLHVEADMISAHASISREQQLAGPGDGAPTRHKIARLEPGESEVLEGEFRLPFPQIVPIRQGDIALLLPLARFRAQAAGSRAVVRTFAVGQPGASGMQPFRLDLGPRVYPQLVQRAFA